MPQIKSSLPSFASDPTSEIYRKRRKRGWSVTELARRSQIEPDLIRHCERTGTLPNANVLSKLEEALTSDNDKPLPPLTVKVVKRTNRYSKTLANAVRKKA